MYSVTLQNHTPYYNVFCNFCYYQVLCTSYNVEDTKMILKTYKFGRALTFCSPLLFISQTFCVVEAKHVAEEERTMTALTA